MSGPKAPIVSAALWVGLGQVAGQGLSLLFFLVLARFVSKESFGTVAVSLAAIEFIRRLLLDPIATAVLAKPDVAKKDYDNAFTLLMIVIGSAILLVLVAASLIALLLGSPQIEAPLRALVVMLLALALAAIPAVQLSRAGQFRTFALRTVVSVVVGGGVGITLALSGWGLWSLVGQQIAGNVIAAGMLWRATEWRPRLTISWGAAKDVTGRARHISATALWNTVAQESDLILVSAAFGPAGAGVYNAAKRIMLSINLLLVHAVSGLMLPTFANVRASDRHAAFLASLRFTSLVSAPAFVGLAALSPTLVNVVLGETWADVAPILAALAASGYFLSLSQIGSSLLIVCGRTRSDARCAGVSAILGVITITAALPFGAVVTAAAVSLAMLIAAPIRLRLASREVGASSMAIVEALVPSLLPAVVMGMTIALTRSAVTRFDLPEWLILMPLVMLGALIYASALRVLSPLLFFDASGIASQLTGQRSRGARVGV